MAKILGLDRVTLGTFICPARRLDRLTDAESLVTSGEISKSTFNRLKLDENKMRDMIQGIRDVAKLEDPVNKKLFVREIDEGLTLYKVSCPIGVLGIIFEARPDVIAQISSLAIKSANAVILKGGKESINTNKTVLGIINKTLDSFEGFPKNVLQQVFTRDDVAQMLKCDKYINLIIPRGGNKLVKFIKENTKIPVLGHADGICSIYVDESADLNMAVRVCLDSKTQYSAACNAVETILVNRKIAKEFLPLLKKAFDESKVVIHASDDVLSIIDAERADDADFNKEFLGFECALKIVDDVKSAIEHINSHGSHHTDAIITKSEENKNLFFSLVDSADVFANCSTRFADGYRFGLGAEVGISTSKIHARGPVGLTGLMSYKWLLSGNGEIVKDYADGLKSFHHKDLV